MEGVPGHVKGLGVKTRWGVRRGLCASAHSGRVMKALGGQSEARSGLSPGSPWLCHPCSRSPLATVTSHPQAEGAGRSSTFDALGFSAAPSATPSIPPMPSFTKEFPPSASTPERLSRAGPCRLVPNRWDRRQEPGMQRVGLHTRLGCSVSPTPAAAAQRLEQVHLSHRLWQSCVSMLNIICRYICIYSS